MDDIRAQLIERREELQIELDRLTEPPEPGASIGFGKRVGDGTAEAVERLSTTAVARSISGSIADIDAALERLSTGSYGICELCGNQIPAERLLARPAATHCVSCAQ